MHGPDDLPGAVYMLFPMLSGNSCLVHMHGPDDLPGTLYMLFPMLSGNSVLFPMSSGNILMNGREW